MISVIVPVYNVEKYLRNCLDTIINQTYKDLEIILVDDGSKDSSGLICDEYAKRDSRIKVIHKENGGLSSARNTGLEIAKGDYIAFIDSDDVIEIDMYEKLLNSLETFNSDVSMCGCKIVDENNNILYQDVLENDIYDINDILENIVLTLKTSAWNKLFKKEIINGIRFPDGRVHGEDLIFILKILNKNIKFSLIEDTCYHYIKHTNSITTGKFSKRSFDEVYCKDEAYHLISDKFPSHKEKCFVWCFRARMNIIRKLFIFKQVKDYKETYNEYKMWIHKNYRYVSKLLKRKEKVEFLLFKLNRFLYQIILKRRFPK